MNTTIRNSDIAEHPRALDALINIASFGGLTSRQLARLLWKDDASGLRLSQRLLQSLHSRKLLLRRRLPNGGMVYVLSQKAGYLLRDQDISDAIIWGHRHLTFHKPMHRMICNEVAIDYASDSELVWPEFMVQRGLAPVPRIVCNGRRKIPDLVIQTQIGMVWVEVENAFKSQARLSELTHVCSRILEPWRTRNRPDIEETGHWSRLIFVAPSTERLVAVVRAFEGAARTGILEWTSLGYVGLRLANISSRYRWKGLSPTFSITTFLDHQECAIAQQKQLQRAILGNSISPGSMAEGELVRFFVICQEALERDLSPFSELVGKPISSYEQLQEELMKRRADLNMEFFIEEADRMLTLRDIHVGNNREYMEFFFAHPPPSDL